MPQSSPRVELPYLQPAQAQKHVTHNAALQRLDAVTQLTVQGFADTTPPALPAAGDIHGVGVGATGNWVGQDGMLAYWSGSSWLFISPQEGWRAWGLSAQELRVWREGGWQAMQPQLQNLDTLGIGGSADSTNRLVVQADGALFSHAGAGHRLSLNKASEEETASVLFQSGWTGHAEMGLAGNNTFGVKISPDGVAWHTALKADPTAQEITLAPASATRMVLGDAGLLLDVPMTGTAVQAGATDMTEGRLMTVGAFGNGVAVTLGSGDDLNAILTGGFYFNPTSHNTPDNHYPVPSAGALVVVSRNSSNITQTFRTYGGPASAASNVRVFERTWGNLGWTPWVELYHAANILGAVSQSGGVPTGGVIERGSNANGEYTRFADGTQICWVSGVNLGSIIAAGVGTFADPYRTDAAVSINWPASFVDAPVTNTHIYMSNGSSIPVQARSVILAAPGTPTSTQWFSLRAQRVSGDATDGNAMLNIMAIGRWF